MIDVVGLLPPLLCFQLMDNVVNTNDLDIDYILIYKDKTNILNEIDFTETDKFICDAIVDNLEKDVAKYVKEGKTVSIPFIGTIENNWYRNTIKAKFQEIKEFKATHTEDEYKEYFKNMCDSIKNEHNENEAAIKRNKRFKTRMLPKYINLCKSRSVIYANAWLKSISLLEVVEFDPDIEEVYERFRLGMDADD